jgi:hypothetical protein
MRLRCWFLTGDRLPEKAGPTNVDNDARRFLAIPDDKRFMPRPDSSVVERGPEKAGVGGSIPSLATTLFPYKSKTYKWF